MKERIIGAIVLVLFVVLVVPVFLDGPSNSGAVINEHVPLPGQSGDENQTIVLNRDRTEPVPAVASNNPDTPAPQREVVLDPEPEPEPEPESEPELEPQAESELVSEPESEAEPAQTTREVVVAAVAEPQSSTGMWAVQLGSFGNEENADKLAADLKKLGFAAFRSQLSTGSGELFRVRVGPQKDRESAEAVAVQLSKAGQKGQVVPHP